MLVDDRFLERQNGSWWLVRELTDDAIPPRSRRSSGRGSTGFGP